MSTNKVKTKDPDYKKGFFDGSCAFNKGEPIDVIKTWKFFDNYRKGWIDGWSRRAHEQEMSL